MAFLGLLQDKKFIIIHNNHNSCFLVLPHVKHCFQRQFLFPKSKICFCYTAETFRVSARHRTMANRENNYMETFREACFLAFPLVATETWSAWRLSTEIRILPPFDQLRNDPPRLLFFWSANKCKTGLKMKTSGPLTCIFWFVNWPYHTRLIRNLN